MIPIDHGKGSYPPINRFHNTVGDNSTQLSPWESKRRGLDPNAALFRLNEPIKFRSDIAGGVIVVSAGTISDLASIPQWAWSLFMAPDDPRIDLPSWIHDYLYTHAGFYDETKPALTKLQADQILAYEAMPECGANEFQCWCVFKAVHWRGKGSWK